MFSGYGQEALDRFGLLWGVPVYGDGGWAKGLSVDLVVTQEEGSVGGEVVWWVVVGLPVEEPDFFSGQGLDPGWVALCECSVNQDCFLGAQDEVSEGFQEACFGWVVVNVFVF